MAKLLYIESSPRKRFSKSIEIANIFLDAYKKNHPDDEIETIDLWNYSLPRFDEHHADAKYSLFDEQPLTTEERRSWKDVEKVINHFKSGDKYLFSVPMWVFTVPYVLKHFMDIVSQPSLTFTYSRKEGFKGLLDGKSAAVIYARGGVYGNGSNGENADLQVLQMEAFLNLVGITDIHSIIVEPTIGNVDRVTMSMAQAKESAKQIAAIF